LIISYIGVLLFVGLTAYDTQKIKQMLYEQDSADESAQKLALLGALSLYLDFVNLFIYLLRILGNRK
jgi:FtsH-binding integral membrane protein